MHSPPKMYHQKKSLVKTFANISNILMGWGNQYSFCNDREVMKQLDIEIDSRLAKYIGKYQMARKRCECDRENLRRLLGVQLLMDCKYQAVIS